MEEFLKNLISTWWGILIIVLISITIWILLSAMFYRAFFKRFYDILISLISLVCFSPLLIALTIIGAIKMKGNPFFLQKRPGKKGKDGKETIFNLIKFRSMTCEKDADGNYLPDDVRLTKYGKMLRSTSLDELPELINVLLGHMSLVGPRPLLVRDMVFMSDDIRNRHNVRGGITGLAQVNGRNSISWEEKFDYDNEYVNTYSMYLDIKIIVSTVIKVINHSGITRDGSATDIDYGDLLLQEGKIDKAFYEEKRLQAREIENGA